MADVLEHIPSFGDLRASGAQVSAFEEARSELAAAGDIPAEHIELGAVVRLDRGFPMIATASGALLRAEHAVDFVKGKRPKRGGRGGQGASRKRCGAREAETKGSASNASSMLPGVGDMVAVRVTPGHDMGVILRVLPRRTAFERWRGKNRGDRQVLAANVDVIFIVQPLGAERDALPLMRDRVARSLVLARDCGAEPVVVLTKVDRCDDDEVNAVVKELMLLAGSGVRVIATSSRTGRGLDEVRTCIPRGTVGMILGESGAGKSTLLNTLLGVEALETNDVRARDDAGRHTTVARIMVALPEPCGVIADCPGLRSLPLVGHERGLARTFPEIVEASHACRFNDCSHEHEPGCAVLEGVEDGSIARVRLDAFLALAAEMRVSAQSLDPDIHL